MGTPVLTDWESKMKTIKKGVKYIASCNVNGTIKTNLVEGVNASSVMTVINGELISDKNICRLTEV